MTAKILMFPASRIAEASAEIFARRTAPDWADDERRMNKILAEMAGNPLPRLGITRIYDLCARIEKVDLDLLLLDFYITMDRAKTGEVETVLDEYADRIMDMVER